MPTRNDRIDSFDLHHGRVLAGKYVVERKLGGGLEGEAYEVTERRTGVRRAAKLFFPQENVRDKAVQFHAKKLDRLTPCSVVVQYHHIETITFKRQPVTCLISQFVEGQLLEDLVASQPGKRMTPFEAMHLLYALAMGVEEIHDLKEYHGDLHDNNILVVRRGVNFDVKIVDLYDRGRASSQQIQADVFDLVRILYDALGGRKRYASQPPEIRAICRGLRKDLISQSFRDAGDLRAYLETFSWSS